MHRYVHGEGELRCCKLGGSATAAASSPPPPAVGVLDTAMVRLGLVVERTAVPPCRKRRPFRSITFFDVFWVPTPPVQRVLFYRLAPDVRASLAHALRAFYPLAGRLRRLAPGSANRHYELHYRPGDTVAFTVAEYDHDIDSLAVDEPREVAALAPLVPPLPAGDGGGVLLAVQVTVLTARRGGRRGLALGVTVHHAAYDGAVSTHFL